MNFIETLTFAGIIGFLTVAIGILVKLIGFPAQIRKNLQRRSTQGLSTTFFLLSFLAYLLWTIHGILQKDTVLILGQGIGILTTAVILWQIYIYRNNK